MLEHLSAFLLEHVFTFLNPADFAQLCSVSHVLNQSVSDYLYHISIKSGRCDRIEQFFLSNKHLLLPYERTLYNALRTLRPLYLHDDLYRLPLFQQILQTVDNSADLVRVSISGSHVFGYLGDMDHVFISHDEVLDRDVVYLKEIAWLIFSTKLPKPNSPVYPATYRVRMHFQVRDDVVWKGDKPMVIRLCNGTTGEVVRHYFIHPAVWKTLVTSGGNIDLSYNNYNDKNLKIEQSTVPTWYFLIIDNVVVEKGDDLCFTIDDRLNVFWKSGKTWDFLEIMRRE